MSETLQVKYYYKINEIPAYSEIILDHTELKQKIINKLEMTTKNNQKYKIIRYDKNFLCDDFILIYGVLKSVVLNSKNRVVCFSPPKSILFDTFCKSYSEEDPNFMDSIVAEEYVEGIMINVFWDETIGLTGSWEIATRNNVGCDYIYRKNKTVREIFLEACIKSNMEIDLLEKRFSYTFILQHPNCDLVTNHKINEGIQLYLIKVYEIVTTGDGTVNIFNVELDKSFLENSNFTHIKFPEIYYDWNTYIELKEKYASINAPYSNMGVVVYNKNTLVRSRIKNPNYERVYNSKTEDFKNEYLYLSLRKQKKLETYLEEYPQYKESFWSCKKYLHLFTENLFQMYIKYYIQKMKKLRDIPSSLHFHLKSLHKIYMSQLKPVKKYVKIATVVEYVNALNPLVLMHSLYLMKIGGQQNV